MGLFESVVHVETRKQETKPKKIRNQEVVKQSVDSLHYCVCV